MTLEARGLERRFGRRVVLRDIDLRVGDGDRVVLVGPNGSGKTTLLRLLAGVLRPTAGTVRHDGIDPATPRGRAGLALVAHDAPAYPELTVREHIDWWVRVHGATPPRHDVVDDAGLGRLADRSAGELSRGQRQRLAIAMALAVQPTTLLLDEPSTALDEDGRAWMTDRALRLGATLVVATHEPGLAAALDATVHHLHGGTLS